MTEFIENPAVPVKKGKKNPNRGVYTSMKHGEQEIRVQFPTGSKIEIVEDSVFGPDRIPRWVWEGIKDKPEVSTAIKDKVLIITSPE